MDRTLALLQNTDPADSTPDSLELIHLEGKNFNATLNLVKLSLSAAVSVSRAFAF